MIIVTVIETISIARVVTMTDLATSTATETGFPPPPEKARLANDGLSCFIPCAIFAPVLADLNGHQKSTYQTITVTGTNLFSNSPSMVSLGAGVSVTKVEQPT